MLSGRRKLRGNNWEETSGKRHLKRHLREIIWEEISEKRHLGRAVWGDSGVTLGRIGIWDHLGLSGIIWGYL